MCHCFDQARATARLCICEAVNRDPVRTGATTDEAPGRTSLHDQLQLLEELPTDILVGLAALAPHHADQLLETVKDLHVLTRLEHVQSMVRGVSATFLHAQACQDCPDMWFSGSRSDRPHRTFWQ